MSAVLAAGRRPAAPPRREHLRIFRRMATNRLDVMLSVAARYGDVVRLPLGPKPLYFFNHPDHVRHVLVENAGNYVKGIGLAQARRALGEGLLTSEGDLWRGQRRTVQPVFQPRRLAGRTDALVDEVEAMVARLRARVGQDPVDVREEMTALSLGVLGRTLLDADLGGFSSMAEDFEAVQDQAMLDMMTLGALPAWLPLPSQLRFRRAAARLHDVVERLAEQRRAEPTPDGADVLSRLLQALDGLPQQVRARRMRDELVTLLLAGHETTASTLSWAFHLIDRHPEVGARLRHEAAAVLGDRRPVHDDLQQLTYTTAVVHEVMRLYPAVWLISRQALADDTVRGYRVPAGTDVVISPYTLHRHPAFWTHPDRFEPERFLAAAAGARSAEERSRARHAYIPFGAGPRFCVGNALGLSEAILAIAMVSRDLRLSGVPGTDPVPEPMLSLRVRGGLPMRVHRAAG